MEFEIKKKVIVHAIFSGIQLQIMVRELHECRSYVKLCGGGLHNDISPSLGGACVGDRWMMVTMNMSLAHQITLNEIVHELFVKTVHLTEAPEIWVWIDT